MQPPDAPRLRWAPQRSPSLTFALGLGLSLFVYGALPFIGLPTLGQVVWATGFSRSFINESLLTIHARNFGAPEPAAMAFGLAGAWPAGLLMAAGLHAAEAYATIICLYMSLAFWGAWRLGRLFGLEAPVAALSATVWLTGPLVRMHAGYSLLSVGFALLPFYFGTAYTLCAAPLSGWRQRVAASVLYVVACQIAIFMDGYTFVMFALATALLGVVAMIRLPALRWQVSTQALATAAIGLGLAYRCYTIYIGKSSYDGAALDFFRGFGVDLTFLVAPSRGAYWIYDVLGLSVRRLERMQFGDPSVWSTSFALPLILVGLAGWWRGRRRSKLATAFLLMALCGTYLSLGPSFKIHARRPAPMQATDIPDMPARFAQGPTGTAHLWTDVPGFRNMRSVYRWLGLGELGLWLLLLMLMADLGERSRPDRRLSPRVALGIALVLLNMPQPLAKWQEIRGLRANFTQLDRDLLHDLRATLRPHERVAFLPYGNDFIVNYLAAQTHIRAYNIGGDKNLAAAMPHWPRSLLQFKINAIDPGFGERVALLLARGKADAVVLPYFDLLWAPHCWPCDPSHRCPKEIAAELAPIVKTLETDTFLQVERRPFFAVVRVAKEGVRDVYSGALLGRMAASHLKYPIRPTTATSTSLWVLADGFYPDEREHAWTADFATLELPNPSNCLGKKCSVDIRFDVFGPSPQRPVTVTFASTDQVTPWTATVTAGKPGQQHVTIPLPPDGRSRRISIHVPQASSVHALTGGADSRILGIDIRLMSLVQTTVGSQVSPAPQPIRQSRP